MAEDDRGQRSGDGSDGSDRQKRPAGRRRERMTPGEVWKLIMGTYKVSLPYLLVFIAGILLATWILTELVF
ncbi:MAG TPA: hypothetical protein VF168_04385 [Trueperaceae bacterium]